MPSTENANPILPLHQKTEAEFQPYADVEIVSTFGEPQAEYSAIRKGAAICDLPQRGILQLTGKDRLDFLNRFLTNELIQRDTKTPLAPGSGVYAFLLNNKGRIVADMNVLELGERTLLESDARNIPVLQSTLEKYVFSEKVAFASQTSQLHQLALHGPKSRQILDRLVANIPNIPPLGCAQITLLQTPVILWRDDPTGTPGYFLVLPAEAAPSIWTEIESRFSASSPDAVQASKRELWPTGWAAFNTTRIEAGRALFGIDFDQTVLPAETGQLSRAVSFTKGCYLGQEIVARMHARQQWSRELVGIKMEEDALPMCGAPVYAAEHEQIGAVTSSTISPILSNAALALAMVKKNFSAPATQLKVAAEGALRKATVVQLPFLKMD
jgi:folate-binding protein YgfZ